MPYPNKSDLWTHIHWKPRVSIFDVFKTSWRNVHPILSSFVFTTGLRPLLLTWFNFDFLAWKNNYIHYKVWDEINHPFPKLQRLHLWRLGMDKFFISHFTVHVIRCLCLSASSVCPFLHKVLVHILRVSIDMQMLHVLSKSYVCNNLRSYPCFSVKPMTNCSWKKYTYPRFI